MSVYEKSSAALTRKRVAIERQLDQLEETAVERRREALLDQLIEVAQEESDRFEFEAQLANIDALPGNSVVRYERMLGRRWYVYVAIKLETSPRWYITGQSNQQKSNSAFREMLAAQGVRNVEVAKKWKAV